MIDEQPLSGGNASGDARVVRAGDTVRKPWVSSTESVLDFVAAIRAAGIDVPASLGRDESGRQIQEYVSGTLASEADPLSHADLHRVGSMVRAIHDASMSYVPPAKAVWHTAIPAPGEDLVCHNDLAPWNLILGDRWLFIDWDASAPSTRLWDLAYAAQAFALPDPSVRPGEAAEGLAAFVEGYAADARIRSLLPAAMTRRTDAMYELLASSHAAHEEPWASMFVEGHGDHWLTVNRYVAAHQDVWSATLGGH